MLTMHLNWLKAVNSSLVRMLLSKTSLKTLFKIKSRFMLNKAQIKLILKRSFHTDLVLRVCNVATVTRELKILPSNKSGVELN